MPIKRVTTTNSIEYQTFEQIWIESWLESAYEIENYIIPGVERFLVYNSLGHTGTFELTPYQHSSEWPINASFPFHKCDELKNKKAFEIDKLTIKKEARGSLKTLVNIFSFLATYGRDNDYDYAITLLNPDVFHVLAERFRVPIERKDNDQQQLPYVPAIINVREMHNSKLGKLFINKGSQLEPNQVVGV
ncbi:hypothetical protein SFC65_19100 [Priestia filamentosa]|uniref:hypothetical protein n=1 Tax=Priestia filamentosa TaxID=1402861 RepID=UPI003981F8D0